MSRDWQEDMELLQKPHKDISDVATILDGIAPYWHYEAEKWRREALQMYPTPEAYDAACAALHKHRERADASESREQKLREAIEKARERFRWGNTTMALIEGSMILSEVVDSLYPKEEEAT